MISKVISYQIGGVFMEWINEINNNVGPNDACLCFAIREPCDYKPNFCIIKSCPSHSCGAGYFCIALFQ